MAYPASAFSTDGGWRDAQRTSPVGLSTTPTMKTAKRRASTTSWRIRSRRSMPVQTHGRECSSIALGSTEPSSTPTACLASTSTTPTSHRCRRRRQSRSPSISSQPRSSPPPSPSWSNWVPVFAWAYGFIRAANASYANAASAAEASPSARHRRVEAATVSRSQCSKQKTAPRLRGQSALVLSGKERLVRGNSWAPSRELYWLVGGRELNSILSRQSPPSSPGEGYWLVPVIGCPFWLAMVVEG